MNLTVVQGRGSTDFEKILVVVRCEGAMTAGDVVQWSDTASTDYPLGITVEDGAAASGRVAGVMTTDVAAAGQYGLCQIWGYNTNITTDGSVASTDLYLSMGTAVAVGQTLAEVEVYLTDATVAYESLKGIFAWNLVTDTGTVGEGFITCMGGGG